MADDPRSHYEAWHTTLAFDAGATAPWHQLLKPHLRLGGRRVLEVAAGRGSLANWMARRPAAERPRQLVAADFAYSALRLARAGTAGAPVVFAQADLARLPFPPHTFDAVVSCETLEHVPDPRQGIGELHRVIAPGGTLYLTMPNYFGTLGVYRWYRERTGREWREEGQPINHPLSSRAMRRWLSDAGFEIAAIDGAGHFVPVPRRQPLNLRALDGIRPLRLLAQHVVFVARKRG